MSEDRRVRYMPLESIPAAEKNPKLHDLDTIVESISRRGFVEIPALDGRTGRLVAGHGRIEALKRMHATGQVAPRGVRADKKGWLVPVLHGWASKDDADANAYLLASNRLVEVGGWDEQPLSEMLEALRAAGEDALTGTGYDGNAVDQLLARFRDVHGEDPGPSDVEGDVWVHRGNLFALGDHRLLCGDSTRLEEVQRLWGDHWGDGRAEVMWTDPPYGVEYEGAAGKLLNDDAAGLPVLLRGAFDVAAQCLAPGAWIYVAHPAGPLSLVFTDAFRAAGFEFRQGLVWRKDAFVLGHSDYHYQHEPLIYGRVPGGKGKRGRGARGWYGDNAQASVLDFPRPRASEQHPTTKPVELVEACLRNSTAPGHLVYEPFAGSGTTLVACERLGRRCYAVELDPRHVQGAVARWEAMTGSKAAKM